MRLVILGLLLLTAIADAAIYKWTDKNGKVHYSDTPIDGAEVVTPAENTLNKINRSKVSPTPSITPKVNQTSYQVHIVSPQDQAALRVNNGDFDVNARVSPKLSDSQTLQLTVDGTRYGEPQRHGYFSLTNVDRGEHVIVVQLLSAEGKVLVQSQPTTVYVHRFSKLFKTN
ncbi:DUF4124 domain-containing protein [Parashewanella spongiae]|nr:DUF4124 domain-containing protein [Parashewanella spongiae]MCL1080122.1 DUF4124 domain-containing protein [Parashewanella spongiae]